ncbi:hypothetical protein [Cellvibrio fibrivorans]|uniref:Uncharacterized protein n=1 Tax=Cellvibrio fibrivorans TaxID=126350 RepID=A0ABU1UZQ1_9GAMM|nr:hypothetical protein [Cellvibrio fibrivorans]MDR7090661.1 hypothetical protein [Cellvibrio fibrivorans]
MDFTFLGEIISDESRVEFRRKLVGKLSKHFFMDRGESIPISCRINSSELANDLEKKWFHEGRRHIVYMENYDVMILSKVDDFLTFLANREPWQDYDVCIFDEEITFCVALTHNEEIKVVHAL